MSIETTSIEDEQSTVQEDIFFDDAEDTALGKKNHLAPEPLFSALLRRNIKRIWPDDQAVHDFVNWVAAPLSAHFAHITAKGGDFVREQVAAGKTVSEVARYRYDQSMRAHLINGLFPVLHIAHTLQRWGAPQFRYYDETVKRLFLAGYVLHDYLKLPAVNERLAAAGLHHDTVNPAKDRPLIEAILCDCCQQLGLDQLLAPAGGVDQLLHDLLYIVSNTQVRWGTLRNLSALPKLALPAVQRDLCEQLSRLADYIAYAAGATPRAVVAHDGLRRELATLSNQLADLHYHHIADVRGVLTNLIQNATLAAWQSPDCVPILFAPSGVVYLTRRRTIEAPSVTAIADNVVQRVKQVAARQLNNNLTGFGRDGKGLKHADYYHLFFDRLTLLTVGYNATFKIIHGAKAASAGKRFIKLAAWMEMDIDPQTMEDIRVDQLAEWCYLAEKTVADLPGGRDAAKVLIDALGLQALYQDFLAVPRDNRAGGVGYHWYFAAGHYFQQNRRLDPQEWQVKIADLVRTLTAYLQEQASAQPAAAISSDDFDDLRRYVCNVLRFGPELEQTSADGGEASSNHDFAAELARYINAKKGRGRTPICALCSSSYTVDKQQEAAVLFAPQVYSNKLNLHGSDAIRDICAICGTEIMLRQLLMNDTSFKGKDFEGRNLRYLYFYPNYFFTPETLAIFREVHDQLRNLSFTELRRQLVDESSDPPTVRLADPALWQRLEPLLMSEQPPAPGQDRVLRLHFPEDEPITFYFLGLPPPGRDAKDAESWVNPALLALLLPLCLDVKVVASASSLPILNEASELAETVLLDGAHAAIGYITGEERLNLDQAWGKLQQLAATYLIHLDGNSGMGSKGYDYRWQDLPSLARSLAESPLYAFHYLKKWQRKGNLDSLPPAKAELYLRYYHYLNHGGKNAMTHAQTLTTLYRRFYRTRGGKSHAIIRPLSIVAEALLDADNRLFDSKAALVEAVHGRLYVRIRQLFRENLAFPPAGSKIEDQDAAIAEFARYFVEEVFFGAFRGDLAALRGKQLNLLKNACEVLYRAKEAEEWRARKAAGEDVQQELEAVLADEV